MSYVLTKIEESTDSKGKIVISKTWESLDQEPPAQSGASNIKRSHADGKYTLTCDFESADSSSESTYSVEGSMSQEPIETHEMFKNISADDWKKWNLWKNNSSDEALNGWRPSNTSGPLSTLAALYEKGITDYLVPRAVVRISKIEGTSPQLSRLGKITSPAGAPTLPSGANWLLTGASGNRQSDGKWSNSYEYMSSGPAGWNTAIYA